jgi:hypothetical protein
LDISSIAAGQPEVMIRFHYYLANNEWWWQVDRFRIGTWTCTPLPGGLVVGNVTDADAGFGLNNATVAGDNGQETKTIPTPLDPQVEDGYYQFFSPAGTHTFTSTMEGYFPVASPVDVIPSDTVRLDFSLPIFSWMEAAPIPNLSANAATAQCPDDPDSFYVIGGWGSAGTPTQTLRYDADTGDWTSLADLPLELLVPSAVCYQGKIYLAGGSSWYYVYNFFYIYDIAANTWTPGPNLPRPVAGAALGVWDGRLYLAGGTEVISDQG